jgi:hypothetical protein
MTREICRIYASHNGHHAEYFWGTVTGTGRGSQNCVIGSKWGRPGCRYPAVPGTSKEAGMMERLMTSRWQDIALNGSDVALKSLSAILLR